MLSNLPLFCYATEPVSKKTIRIVRGEKCDFK